MNPENPKRKPKELAASRTKVLIVDDTPNIVKPLCDYLRSNG